MNKQKSLFIFLLLCLFASAEAQEAADSAKALDEVVVVGYGTQSKKKVTGSVSSVSGEDMQKYSAATFETQLAGKVAGVQINQSNANPGSGSDIVIRGIGTLTAGSSPLIVVDGFPLTEGSSLNLIDPSNIESIEILKDASSAAIYGSRGANGVVLVKTKSAKGDKFTIHVNAYYGIQQISTNMKFVDAYDAATYFTEARDWGYVSKDPNNRSINDDPATRKLKERSKRALRLNYITPYLNKTPGLINTNWIDEVFRTAPISNYNVSFSGATKRSTYYASVGYFEQQGIMIHNSFKRYSSSLKLNSKIHKAIEFEISLNPSYSQYENPISPGGNFSSTMGQIKVIYPFFRAYDEKGNPAISEQIIANNPEDGALVENPVASQTYNTNNSGQFRIVGNSFLKINILKGLSYKLLIGGDFMHNENSIYRPSYVGAYRTRAPKAAEASEKNNILMNYLIENTLNYQAHIKKHNLNALLGYSYQHENTSSTLVSGSNIPDDNITNLAGANDFTATVLKESWTLISYFGRVQYDYRNTYLLSASLRTDGSSRFSEGYRFGAFPSVSLGYIVSNEKFFPRIRAINFLKLRASWGQTGNNQIGNFSAISTMNADPYVFNNQLTPGVSVNNAPNARLTWEKNSVYNVGMDIGILSHINLGLNYYISRTTDLLLNVPVPEQSGFSSQLRNIGEMSNQGFELEIQGNNFKAGPIDISFQANLTTYDNKIVSLPETQRQILKGQYNVNRTHIGAPIAEYYGYKVIGVYKTEEELKSIPSIAGTLLGDYIVEDVNGDRQSLRTIEWP